jgi:hypothetical protein
MTDYCLLPRDCQKDFAAYMTKQYGVDYGRRYLAVVTNPLPVVTGKYGGREKGNRQLPQITDVPLKKVFDRSQS